jgi:hypothetical protein
MLHAGLDLSRKKIDVCLLSEQGEHLGQLTRRLMATHCGASRGGSRRAIASRSAR